MLIRLDSVEFLITTRRMIWQKLKQILGLSSDKWRRIKRALKSTYKAETEPRSLQESNSLILSSYLLAQSPSNEGEFTFLTDNGSLYSLFFTDGSSYFPDTAFSASVVMIGFNRVYRASSSGDADLKVIGTIVLSLHEAFMVNPKLVLIYCCSQRGGLQRKRSQIFQAWFNEYSQEMVKIDCTDDDSTYISAIFKENHPHKREIVERFLGFAGRR